MSSDLFLLKKKDNLSSSPSSEKFNFSHLYSVPSVEVRTMRGFSQDKIKEAYFNHVENLLLSDVRGMLKKEPNNPYWKEEYANIYEDFENHKKSVTEHLKEGYQFVIDG